MDNSVKKVKEDWKSLRIQRLKFILSVISIIPISFLINLIESNAVSAGLFLGWLLFILFPIGLSYLTTKCPRCGNTIFYRGHASVFSNKCLWCGIEVGRQIENRDE